MPVRPTGHNSERRAVVLVSGGLDSAVTLFMAREEGYRLFALSLDYGQTHLKELERATCIAQAAGADWKKISISLPWGGSTLTGPEKDISSPRSAEEMAKGIPDTYVPARNTIFLSFAISWAEAAGAEAVFIGANAIDYSGYPDCRPEYFEQFQRVIQAGTREGTLGRAPFIRTPLVKLSKAEIIQRGEVLGVPFHLTWSCYRGGDRPCMNCESCILRAQGFKEAGLTDPLLNVEAGVHPGNGQ
jgi:7-cyano-7-deazaguanine synthase